MPAQEQPAKAQFRRHINGFPDIVGALDGFVEIIAEPFLHERHPVVSGRDDRVRRPCLPQLIQLQADRLQERRRTHRLHDPRRS